MMMEKLSRDEARARIHDAGLRATAPRVAVLRLLSKSKRPLSHSDVVDAVGESDWDQATLYRNLIKLTQTGLVRVASQVGGVTRYEAKAAGEGPHLHPHFSCRECGNVKCLPEAELAKPVDPAWRAALADADLQIVGQCPSCRRRRKKSVARRK